MPVCIDDLLNQFLFLPAPRPQEIFISSANASYFAGSSPGSKTLRDASPCLIAFRAAIYLPSIVRGPVERAAFARFAANCFGVLTARFLCFVAACGVL